MKLVAPWDNIVIFNSLRGIINIVKSLLEVSSIS
jgi:hypothetical protein